MQNATRCVTIPIISEWRCVIKRKILFSLLSLVLVLALVIPTACVPKRTATNESTATTDQERITALESKISQLQSKIASLPETDTTDYSADIVQLQDDIANLQTEFDGISADVDATLTAWEEEQATNTTIPITNEGLVTRWLPSVELSSSSSASVMLIDSYNWYPTRIKEEDTYRLTINLIGTPEAKEKLSLVVLLTSSSKDTSVDTAETGIYSNSPASIWWDSEFTPSDGINCRRIGFTSDEFTVKSGTYTAEAPYVIKADFDLYYASSE